MAIEIATFPMKHCDFHCYVSLPEGNWQQLMATYGRKSLLQLMSASYTRHGPHFRECFSQVNESQSKGWGRELNYQVFDYCRPWKTLFGSMDQFESVHFFVKAHSLVVWVLKDHHKVMSIHFLQFRIGRLKDPISKNIHAMSMFMV